jgi:hypothetical protein
MEFESGVDNKNMFSRISLVLKIYFIYLEFLCSYSTGINFKFLGMFSEIYF